MRILFDEAASVNWERLEEVILSNQQVDKHAARVACAITKAVNERTELLPYMRKLLVNNVIDYLNTLSEDEIDAYIQRQVECGKTQEKG